MSKCNIVLNGEHYNGIIDTSIFTIAVDGGYNMLEGKSVDVFVGDCDSVKAKSILSKESIRLNPEKDMTDGEYAVDYAIEHGYKDIYLYGVDGGRLDHIMANLYLFNRANDRGARIIGVSNRYNIYFSAGNDVFTIDNVKGKTISIVPFEDSVHIIDMKGLYYKVADFEMDRLSTRGISNVAVDDSISVSFGKGKCFIFVLSKED